MQTYSRSLHPVRTSCALLAAVALSWTSLNASEAMPIDIMCSPSVVVLGAVANGDWMTVHTDVPYRDVIKDSIELNGLAVAATKADNRGNLVAKFDLTELKAQLEPGPATLTLTGVMITGVTFAGSDVVRVVASPSPQGRSQAGPKATPVQSRRAPWAQE